MEKENQTPQEIKTVLDVAAALGCVDTSADWYSAKQKNVSFLLDLAHALKIVERRGLSDENAQFIHILARQLEMVDCGVDSAECTEYNAESLMFLARELKVIDDFMYTLRVVYDDYSMMETDTELIVRIPKNKDKMVMLKAAVDALSWGCSANVEETDA